jgi:hypothetical protein
MQIAFQLGHGASPTDGHTIRRLGLALKQLFLKTGK